MLKLHCFSLNFPKFGLVISKFWQMKFPVWCWVFLLLFAACRAGLPERPEDYPQFIGKEFPDFELRNLSGEIIRWSDYKGKPALINFWFAKCPPCVAEIPHLNDIQRDFSQEDVVFLGITPDDSLSTVHFAARHKFSFTLLPDAQQFINYFGNEYPMNVFVDKKGIIRHARGAIPTSFNEKNPQGFMDDRAFRRFLGQLIRER
jgi:cytochrome c biogenesis protein CcmG/thiol:disulfide interchange protein DsbE